MTAMTKSRRAAPTREDAPLSMRFLVVMLGIVGALGLTIITETELPAYTIAVGGAVGLLVLFLVGLTRPEIPLYLLAAYLPFSKQLAGDFNGLMTAFNLTNLLFLIVIISWMTGSATGRQPAFEGHRLHVPVMGMTFWALFGFMAFASKHGDWYVGERLDEIKRWLDPIVLYFLFFHLVQDRQRWKNLVVIMMLSVVVVAAMAIWEYHGNAGSSGSLESARVYGIADNPNSLGAFFTYYMFLFGGFWLQRLGSFKRWGLLVPLLLCVRGIMVTFSRGAYLACAAGALGLAFRRSKVLFIVVCWVIGFALLNPSVLPHGIRYRLFDTTFKDRNTELVDVYGMSNIQGQVDASASERLVIWEGAKRMIAANPILGVGLGQFQLRIQQYAPLTRRYDAHNAYLLAAAEQGVPMLVVFVLFLVMQLWMTHRVVKHARDPFIQAAALGWFGGLSALIVANMFGSRINSAEVSGYFWILAALMARADVWIKTDAAAARQPRRASGPASAPSEPVLASWRKVMRGAGGP